MTQASFSDGSEPQVDFIWNYMFSTKCRIETFTVIPEAVDKFYITLPITGQIDLDQGGYQSSVVSISEDYTDNQCQTESKVAYYFDRMIYIDGEVPLTDVIDL